MGLRVEAVPARELCDAGGGLVLPRRRGDEAVLQADHHTGRVWGLGLRLWDPGFRVGVCGLGFGVWGLGLRVEDLEFRAEV